MSSRGAPSLPKSAPRPGEFISGAYRVDHALGAGGMGYVLAVTRLADGAPLAIKMLNPELAENPRIVARFLHEARAAQAITSEHVTRVLDVGTLPSGTPFLVMERLHGVDLGTWLEQHHKVPFAQTVDWTLEACEALAEAHALRYVHRDLKPSNLFLARGHDPGGRPFVKVLDFGIAKSLDTPDQSKLTTTSSVIGSPAYMSPEQLRSSKTVDVHSDIWSLGVVMYELITGVLPFDAPTLPELSVLILTSKPFPMTAHDASLPVALSRVVDACLHRDPSQRFGNLAELAYHLAPFGTPFARESAERVIARLGLPPARVALWSRDELASTMAAPPPTQRLPAASVSAPTGSTAATLEPAMVGGNVRARASAGRLVATALLVATVVGSGGALYAWTSHSRSRASAAAAAAVADAGSVAPRPAASLPVLSTTPAPTVAPDPPAVTTAATGTGTTEAAMTGAPDASPPLDAGAPAVAPTKTGTPARPPKKAPSGLFSGEN